MNAELKTVESIGQLTVRERAVIALGSAERETQLITLAAKTTDIVTITNTAGYEQVRAARIALKNERIDVQKCGKKGRDEANKLADAIIAEEKRLVAIVEPEEDRLQSIQDAWEAKVAAEKEAKIQIELKRVANLQSRIAELRGCQTLSPTSGSALIAEHIADLDKIPTDSTFEEFEQQALDARLAGLKRLGDLHVAALAHEAAQLKLEEDRKELARLQAAEAERQRLAQEAQAKADADAQAERDRLEALAKVERDAESARQAEAHRLERERIAKEEADAKALRDAEAKRLADERAENARIAAERQAELDAHVETQRLTNAAEEQRLADQRAEVARQQEALRISKLPPAKRPRHNPGSEALIEVIAEHYGVDSAIARRWLREIDWETVAA